MIPGHGMLYVDDLKKATPAEFDAVLDDWQDTVERQYECLSECEDTPTRETLDGLEPDHAMAAINNYVQSVEERANDWVCDATEWGKIAEARVEARAKAAKAKKRFGKWVPPVPLTDAEFEKAYRVAKGIPPTAKSEVKKWRREWGAEEAARMAKFKAEAKGKEAE